MYIQVFLCLWHKAAHSTSHVIPSVDGWCNVTKICDNQLLHANLCLCFWSSSFSFGFCYAVRDFIFMLFSTKSVRVCECVSRQSEGCVSRSRRAEHGGLTDRLCARLSKGQWELSSTHPPHTPWISHWDSMPVLWIICCQGNFTLTLSSVSLHFLLVCVCVCVLACMCMCESN